MSEKKETTLIQIGDHMFDEESITPAIYFDYVKGLKQKVDSESYQAIIDTGLSMIEKTKLTGQTEMAKRTAHQIELAIRELEVAEKGFDIFVNRKDIERYIDKVEGKAIKIIELSRFTRDIPDEAIEKIAQAKDLFDQMYVVFTDYTLAETKKVAKERRDKDPILFGAFVDPDSDGKNNIYLEDRFFFICDWVDDKCDLTLEEIVRGAKAIDGKDITYKSPVSFKDKEEVKKYINSFNNPIEELEPVSLFDKIKKKVSKSNPEEAPKKKRGRPRKKKVEE